MPFSWDDFTVIEDAPPIGEIPWNEFEKLPESAPALVAAPMGPGSTLADYLRTPMPIVAPWEGGVVRSPFPNTLQPEDLRPAIRLIGGELVEGKKGDTHPDIIADENIKAVEMDQRGFMGPQGEFYDREGAAQGTGLPTVLEPGRLHSTDLSAWQDGVPALPEPEQPEPIVTIPKLPEFIKEGVSTPTRLIAGEQIADLQKSAADELWNAAKSVPEFLTTEEGALAFLASLTPVGRAGVTAYFTQDMARSLIDQAKELGGKWSDMTPDEKVRGLVRGLSTAAFTVMLGKSAVGEARVGAKVVRDYVRPPAAPEVPPIIPPEGVELPPPRVEPTPTPVALKPIVTPKIEPVVAKAPAEVTAVDLVKMSPEEVVAWKKGTYSEAKSLEMSKAVKPEDVPEITAERDRLQAEYQKKLDAAETAGDEYKAAVEKGDTEAAAMWKDTKEKTLNEMQAAGPIQLKAQTLTEMLRDAPKAEAKATEIKPAEPATTPVEVTEPKPLEFIGSGEPGQIIGGRVIIANEKTKKAAQAIAADRALGGKSPTVEGYLNGKHKRGWVVTLSEEKPSTPISIKPAPVESAPVAAAKVEQVLSPQRIVTEDVPLSNAGAKKARSILIREIKKLSESAPKEQDIPTGKATEKVTIEIPGDGEFTVFKTKENLEYLLKRAKGIKTSPPKGFVELGVSKEDKAWIEQQLSKPTSAPEVRKAAGIVRSAEMTGKPMTEPALLAELNKRYGIKQGGAVHIVSDHAKAEIGWTTFDAEGKPTGIVLNRARIATPGDVYWVMQHEGAHWFDLSNPGTITKVLEKMTPKERNAVEAHIAANYKPTEFRSERIAYSVQRLADAWKGRGWFTQIVGRVMAFANETLGVKLTRTAAERMAALAVARGIEGAKAVRSAVEARPIEGVVKGVRERQEEPYEITQARDIISQYENGRLSSKDYKTFRRAQDMVTRYDEQQAPAGIGGGIEAALARKSEAGSVLIPKGVTDAVQKSAEYVKSLADEELKAPKMTDRRRAVLNWSAKLQRSFNESELKQRAIIKAVPKAIRREGITNWIQADGDATVLRQRANATADPKLKAGYEAALTLTPDELAIANQVKADYADFAKRGQAADVLGQLKENYVTQTWDMGKGPSGGATGRTLKEKFRFSKASTFSNFFEGEQAGYVPKTKDIAKLLPMYAHEMNSVIAAREMVAELGKGKAKDGRPLLAPKGIGVPVDSAEGGKATLVMPKVGKEETADYKVLPNQPALSGWKWVSKDEAGNPIFLKADLALHPEAYTHLKNVLGRSAIREWYGSRTTALAEIPKMIVKGLDMANSETKRTMLGLLATFHQIQTGTHAVGHRVNPFFNIPKIDLVNNKLQMDAAQHGLMLAPDRASMDQFMEGFRTSGIISRIPGIGPVADYYGHYLFHDYIPGLKFKTYDAILNRNTHLYDKAFKAGKVDLADIKVLSAEQANAAYGHINYADLGRNPTIQHVAQLGLLAPDFLEARSRFAGQAIKGIGGAKVGREQLMALATLAIAQSAGAYAAAKLTDGEWDWKRPFEFTQGNRRYTLRSVPEDIQNLLTKTRQFVHNRLSPMLGKGTIQYLTGIDYRGRKVSAAETTKELLAQPVPLTIRGFTGLSPNTLSGMEQLMGSLGLRISRFSPQMDVRELVTKFKETSPDPKLKAEVERQEKEVFASVYEDLRRAIQIGDPASIRKEYEKLTPIRTPKQINAALKPWTGGTVNPQTFAVAPRHTKPFTGSRETEAKFIKSLTPDERETYNQAIEERKRLYQVFRNAIKP